MYIYIYTHTMEAVQVVYTATRTVESVKTIPLLTSVHPGVKDPCHVFTMGARELISVGHLPPGPA